MTSQLTKKQYLEIKYKEFTNELSKHVSADIFPTLDDVCMVDILFYFSITFQGMTDYEETVRNLLSHHSQVNDATFDKIYPIIKTYIDNLKEFLKTN
jgi:hypothetical protein